VPGLWLNPATSTSKFRELGLGFALERARVN